MAEADRADRADANDHHDLDLIDPMVRTALRTITLVFTLVVVVTTVATNVGESTEWTTRGLIGVVVIAGMTGALVASFVQLGKHRDLAGLLWFAIGLDAMAVAFTLLSPPAHAAVAALPLLGCAVLLGVKSSRVLVRMAIGTWVLSVGLFVWGQIHGDEPPLMSAGISRIVHSIVFATLAALLLIAIIAFRNRLTRAVGDLESDVAQRRLAEQRLHDTIDKLGIADSRQRDLLHELISAEEAERKGTSIGLHDDPVQKLVAALLRMQTHPDRLEEATTLINESLGSLRHMMFELHPRTLDEHGISAAADELVASFADTLPPTQVDTSVDAEVPSDTRIIAFRVLVEALANVSQHANASNVSIRITEEGDELLLVVEDDGVGMSDDLRREGRPGHYGLPTMFERTRLAGGRARIDSRVGGGTKVSAWLPLHDSAGPEP